MEQLQPFLIDGTPFTPLCWLIQVDEPEFGCEGRPDGQPVCGSVHLLDRHGERTVPIEETTLFASRLDDRMWIGTYGGQIVLVSRRRDAALPLNEAETRWWNRQRI